MDSKLLNFKTYNWDNWDNSKLIVGTIENRLTPPAPVSQTMGARLLRDLPRLACCSVLETTLLTWTNFHVLDSCFLEYFLLGYVKFGQK